MIINYSLLIINNFRFNFDIRELLVSTKGN